MTYLSFWHAFTYRKAMAKNTTVKNNIVTSCISTPRNAGAGSGSDDEVQSSVRPLRTN
jgi:hypothetical protein